MSAVASISTTLLPDGLDMSQQEYIVDGIVTLTGSYPANGDTLDLSKLSITSNQLPTRVELFEATPAPGPASGFAFLYLPGATQALGLMEMFNGTTQQTGATYASILTVTGFVLRFRAWFPKFI
jgi:hypothetical protein